MTEYHKPTRAQSLLFFFASLLLAVCVLLWVFVLNKGTLTVKSVPPFNIKVGGADVVCGDPQCSVKLTPKQYSVITGKDGFFDDVQNAVVRRGKDTLVTVELIFKPVVREFGPYVMPSPDAPLRPPFLGQSGLENFPKNPKKVLFSPSGARALIFIGRELYVYEVASRELNKVPVALNPLAVWVDEKIAYLDTSGETPKFNLISGDKTVEIASFGRPFSNPAVLGGSQNFALIEDNTAAGKIYYLIDVSKKSRKRLDLDFVPTSVKLTKSYALFETAGGIGATEARVLDMETLTQHQVAAVGIGNAIETISKSILYISRSKKDSDSPQLGLSISEVLEEAKNGSAVRLDNSSSLFLTEYSTGGNYRNIVEIPIKDGESVGALTGAENESALYFVLTGTDRNKKIFKIQLKETGS